MTCDKKYEGCIFTLINFQIATIYHMKNVYKKAQTNGLAIESSYCSCIGTEFIVAPISQPWVILAPGEPMLSSGPRKCPSPTYW